MPDDDAPHPLIGTWRMEAWTGVFPDTGEGFDALGPAPLGYIAYHADGRMMATVFARDRLAARPGGWTDAEKVALFDTMLAYVARWRIEGDRVIHSVEGAWNPSWQVDLTRPFTLSGDRLEIAGAPSTDPATGRDVVYRMVFRKVVG
ncbi:lipocalin-like domain-containing protein [Roseicyclus persicicus]|uniref:Lipocalin-like domain-containing protein n=1 Tax=Roseicyclus persicicus TaxID=2650661 RepID=A0A7X6H1Q5_9RHOB|nr:lipocalin-like domain-containing protein [Roseibacterium persicicum]NKX46456.1 lipocalin-like domain-containing protein [Roseibacterium persicicum]